MFPRSPQILSSIGLVNQPQIWKYEQNGVLLGFSQNELKENSTRITTKNCTVRAYAVIQRVYLYTNQSPTTPISKELEGSPQNHKRGEREKPRTQELQKFQQGYKLRFEAKEPCGPDWRPFLGLNLKIKNTVEGYKIAVDHLAQEVATRGKTRSSRMSSLKQMAAKDTELTSPPLYL